MNEKRKSGIPRFMKVKYDGRTWIWIGALLILALAGYELWVRMDDFIHWTSAVRYLSKAKNESFFEDMAVILSAPSMQELRNIIFFLIVCVVFSLVSLIYRNRPLAACAIIPLDAAVFCLGCFLPGVTVFTFGGLLQFIKLIPMIMILAGCIINLTENSIRKRYERNKNGYPEDEEQNREEMERKNGNRPYFRDNADRDYWKYRAK